MMPAQDNNERWEEIRNIHREYKLFYQICIGVGLFGVGVLVGIGSNTAGNSDNVLIGIFVGLVVGLCTNLASWWILFHGIVPMVSFSDHIEKIAFPLSEENMSGCAYRIVMENLGSRTIIDVEVMARLRIRGQIRSRPNTWIITHMRFRDGNEAHRIPRMLPKRALGPKHLVGIRVNESIEFWNLPELPETIKSKIEHRCLLLEDLLVLGSEASLEFQAFGYDELSGTRKLFVSKRYTINDIQERLFTTSEIEADLVDS